MAITSHPYIEAVLSALDADASTPSAKSLTDGRMHEDALPDDPELPALRIALVSDPPDQRLASGDSSTGTVQIDVYAHRDDRETAWDINGLARGVLDRKDLTATGFANVHGLCVERGRPIVESGFYRVRSRYRLFGSRS